MGRCAYGQSNRYRRILLTALIAGVLPLLLAACEAGEQNEDCPVLNCAACGDRVVWFETPDDGAQVRIGDTITVTVAARSGVGVESLGFVALGELSGVPLQLAHETISGAGRTETMIAFEFVVPFNANLTRVVLIALAEDASGHLAAQGRAVIVNPYP